MKKSFLLACLALCGITTVHAQSDNQATLPQPSAYVVEQRNLPDLHMGYSERGYRGFVELGGVVGMETPYGKGDKVFAMSTTHGWNFSPYFFLGAGVGFQRHLGEEQDLFFFPVFADIRMNVLDTRISPYIGLKAGYSLGKNTGFFCSPSIGLNLGVTKGFGFDIALGYNLQSAEIYSFNGDDFTLAHSKNINENHKHYEDIQNGKYTLVRDLLGGLTLKIGIYF